MVYPVSEDSLLLVKVVRKFLKKPKNKDKIMYLDMGAGSGVLAETAINCGIKKEKIFCVDINSEAVKFVKNKGFNCIKSNLFSKLKGKKFDLISFNAPYLPENKYDKKPDTTGGKRGDEVAIRFLKQVKKHLNNGGKVFLLISSLTPFDRIKKFGLKIIARKKIFFEELLVLEI